MDLRCCEGCCCFDCCFCCCCVSFCVCFGGEGEEGVEEEQDELIEDVVDVVCMHVGIRVGGAFCWQLFGSSVVFVVSCNDLTMSCVFHV